MNVFLPILYGALLVEGVVTTIGNIKDRETSWKYWAAFAGGLIVAVLVSLNYDLDFFKALGLGEGKVPYVGAVLTGIIMSRGANIVADLAGSLNAFKKRNGNSVSVPNWIPEDVLEVVSEE